MPLSLDGIAMCQLAVSNYKLKERASMGEVSTIGVDLAKNVFQVHGAAADGSVLFRKKLSRPQFARFMAQQPPCLVAMEACASAHHRVWEMVRYGHEVRPIAPHYVSRSSKRQKNDAADAEAMSRRPCGDQAFRRTEVRGPAGAGGRVPDPRAIREAAH